MHISHRVREAITNAEQNSEIHREQLHQLMQRHLLHGDVANTLLGVWSTNTHLIRALRLLVHELERIEIPDAGR